MPPLVTSRHFQSWRQEGTESLLIGKQQAFYGGGCLCLLLTITLKMLPHLKKQLGHPVRAPVFCRLSSLTQALLSRPDDLSWSILILKEPEGSSVRQGPVRDAVPPMTRACEEAAKSRQTRNSSQHPSMPLQLGIRDVFTFSCS